MKVLVTGANGFVGSHLVEVLCERNWPAVLLLRPAANRRFLAATLPHVEVRLGSLSDPASLRAALAGVTHVIHCAGLVKALRPADYFTANQAGTRNLVEAVNAQAGVRRLVHLSSLAAAGPAVAAQPAREDRAAHPVSDYGRSKLAGEDEVRRGCRQDFVILRPPGVYGPRDGEFLKLFQAVKAHLCPMFGGGRQELSLVYVRDLAEIAVACLDNPAAAGKTFFVAHPEVVTAGTLARLVAAQMNTWTVPLWLPTAALWPVCAAREIISHFSGVPDVLNRQKYAELSAPGWVCDVSRLQREAGLSCPTDLRRGLARTLEWYRQQGWL